MNTPRPIATYFAARQTQLVRRLGTTTIIGIKRLSAAFLRAFSAAFASAIALFLSASLNSTFGIRTQTLHDQEV